MTLAAFIASLFFLLAFEREDLPGASPSQGCLVTFVTGPHISWPEVLPERFLGCASLHYGLAAQFRFFDTHYCDSAAVGADVALSSSFPKIVILCRPNIALLSFKGLHVGVIHRDLSVAFDCHDDARSAALPCRTNEGHRAPGSDQTTIDLMFLAPVLNVFGHFDIGIAHLGFIPATFGARAVSGFRAVRFLF